MTLMLIGFIVIIVALLASSVINIVVYRAPIKLFHDWHDQASEFLQDYQDPDASVKGTFSFQSICNQCQKAITHWRHFPIIGFFVLRKHTKECAAAASLSWRPFLLMMTCVLFSFLVFYQYQGAIVPLAGLLFFTWVLLTLSVIDFDHHLILDNIVMPLLWIGLLLNCFNLYAPLRSAVFGAGIGYLMLLIPSKFYVWITKRESIGIGDYKLAGALGAWVGSSHIVTVILSSLVFLFAVMIFRMLGGWRYLIKPLPFGPFLSISAWLVLVYQFNLAHVLIRIFSRS